MKIIKKIILFALLLTVIQQFPYIKENYYSQIRIFLYITLGILACIGFFISNQKLARLIWVFFICTMLWFLLMLIFYISGLNLRNPYNSSIDILEPMIPLGMLILSNKFNFDDNEINRFINIYIILVTMMGITNIYFYGIGLEIPKIYIREISKNQVGPILSISSIICYFLFLLSSQIKKRYIKHFYIIFFVIDIICLALIRNRSGLLATFIIIFIFSFLYFRQNKRVKYYITSTLLIVLITLLINPSILKNIFSFFYDSFTANYDILNIDNLSAGRISIYELSIIFLKDNILLGELNSSEYMPGIAHNYLLNKIVKYGLIGSFPLILLYFYLIIFIIKEIMKHIKNNKFIDLSILLILQGIIISFFEYTYPYGPGVSQALSWFLLGYYLFRNYRETKINRHERVWLTS